MRIIRRYRDEERWERVGSWRLVYGRRKTGKSFFVREFTEWDRYYFVLGRNEVLDLDEDEKMNKDSFFREMRRTLGEERIVVDEFQRLGREFQERLHAWGRRGELTLITSSLYAVKAVFEPGAPLLGLVDEFPMGLISPSDMLKNLGREVELAVLLRDPWLIEEEVSLERILSKVGNHVDGIVAEIFFENEKRLTEVYIGTMEAVAAGWRRLTDIYYYLKNKGIGVSHPPALEKYLKVLSEIGIFDRLKVWGMGRRFVYVHASPIFDLHYYLRDRYGYPDVNLGFSTIKEVFRQKVPIYVEHFVRILLSEVFSLPAGVFMKKDTEIDVVLGLKRAEVLAEVKWKEELSKSEVRRVEEAMKRAEELLGRVRRKILFVKDASGVPETELEVWDVEKIGEMAK